MQLNTRTGKLRPTKTELGWLEKARQVAADVAKHHQEPNVSSLAEEIDGDLAKLFDALDPAPDEPAE